MAGSQEVTPVQDVISKVDIANGVNGNTSKENGASETEQNGAEGAQPPAGLNKNQKKKLKAKAKKQALKEGGPVPTEQTSPPSVPVSKLFPDGNYPAGEICSYKDDNIWRETSEEKKSVSQDGARYG